MKIALVYPGDRKQIFFQPPLSLGYLASYAMKYGGYSASDIRIIDENAGTRVLEQVKQFSPDIVGITATTPLYRRAEELAQKIKEWDKDTRLWIGGPHATAVPELTIKSGPFDTVIIGEGEKTTLELLKLHEKTPRPSKLMLSRINGISFLSGKTAITTEPRKFIENLDTIPFPARELMDMEFYLKPRNYNIRGVVGSIAHVMSSRGCPYNCVYCSNGLLWRQRVRYFSAEYVLSEVQHLIKTYDLDGICFQDDMFNAKKDRFEKICNLMKASGLDKKIFYSCQLRANLVDRSTMKLLKESGCVQVEFGFESGSERVLKYLKCGSVSVEQNRTAVKLAKEYGIRVLGNFVIGAPDETVEDIKKTEEFYKENDIDFVSVFMLTPLPGSKIWDELEDEDIKFSWNRLWISGLEENNVVVSKRISEADLKNIWLKMARDADNGNMKHSKAGIPARIKELGYRLMAKIIPKRASRRGFHE